MGGHGSSASLQAVKLIRPLENNSYTQYVISCVTQGPIGPCPKKCSTNYTVVGGGMR